MLPEQVSGRDVVELGCGTGYVSAWLARRGARPVGLDTSARQLETARRFQAEFGLSFPLIQANAEQVPLRDETCDVVISEYGASIWCDPYRWIAEAGRLLRPGGWLTFLVGGSLLSLCTPDEEDAPAGDHLLRPYFHMHRFDWTDGSVEFHLTHSDMFRLLVSCGFVVHDLKELRPSDGSVTRYPHVSLRWAQQWPSEEVWVARKTSDRLR